MKRVLDNRHWNKTRSTLMKGAKDKSHSSRRRARQEQMDRWWALSEEEREYVKTGFPVVLTCAPHSYGPQVSGPHRV